VYQQTRILVYSIGYLKHATSKNSSKGSRHGNIGTTSMCIILGGMLHCGKRLIAQSDWGKFDEISDDLLADISSTGKFSCTNLLICIADNVDAFQVLRNDKPLSLKFDRTVLDCTFRIETVSIASTFVYCVN